MMRVSRRFSMAVMFVCVFGAASMSGWGQAAKFAGTYKYAGGTQEDDAREAAIEKGVASMGSFARGTARSRITATTQILASYIFTFEPGKITVNGEGRPLMVSGDKGEAVEYVFNGKKSTLTQTLTGDRLTQVFASDDGKRENEFAFSPDGQTVTLKVTLTISRLSSPIVYSLTYKRAG